MNTTSGGRCRVLALAPNAWDGQWMNRQQILSRLGRHHEVLYSNGPWRVWDRSRPGFRDGPWLGAFERRDGVLVDRPSRLILRWPGHRVDALAEDLARRRWTRQLGRMGKGPVVLYLFHPGFARYIRHLRHDVLVYHPYDLFSRMPGWSPELQDHEARLLAQADLIIATSEATRDELAARSGKDVQFIPNGVDVDLFRPPQAPEAQPAVLAAIPRPRIGYVGSLNRKVDLALVARLAGERPDWQFVLIGPDGNYDDETRSARQACDGLVNVHFTGSQPREELPACMRALDVGLMCYRLGTWMDGAYPLKLNEYLACGLPVVSSDLRSVRELQHVLQVARDPADWATAIARALAGQAPGTPEERRAAANRNSWDVIADRVGALLLERAGAPGAD